MISWVIRYILENAIERGYFRSVVYLTLFFSFMTIIIALPVVYIIYVYIFKTPEMLTTAYVLTFSLIFVVVTLLVIPIVNTLIRFANDMNLAVQAANDLSEKRQKFLGYVTHEIRNPLNGILGVLSNMDRHEMPPKIEEKFDMVRSSADSLYILLSDVLDLGKTESGAMLLEAKAVDLRAKITEIYDFWRPKANKVGLEITLNISKDFPKRVVLDEYRFQQIAHNLISNSIKYTDKGSVSLSLNTLKGDEGFELVIRDTGRGIPAGMQESIFEPYTRVGTEASQIQRQGTGLGLPIARQLAQLMGGNVWSNSDIKEGSEFHFTGSFEVLVDHESLDSADNIAWQKLRVLVVDDSRTNAFVLNELLKKSSIAAEICYSVDEAIEKIKTFQPHIMFADDHLGGARYEDWIGDHIETTRVIAYSGATTAEALERFRNLGLLSYLPKPTSEKQMKKSIFEALSKRPQIDLVAKE